MDHLSDCCRACLRRDCNFTQGTALDRDNTKIVDKLAACIPEIMWQNGNCPVCICSLCIEKLRTAFDFRIMCLQSDTILHRPLITPTNVDIGMQTGPFRIAEHSDYINFKQLLEESEANKLPCEEPASTNLETNIISITNNIENVNIPANVTDVPKENSANITDSSNNESNAAEIENRATISVVNRETQTPVVLLTQSNEPFVQPKHLSKRYACNICNKDYSSYSNLAVHKKSHLGEKPNECKYCEKRFVHLHHLREHIRRHTGEKPFACLLCNKRFTIRAEVNTHMKSHSGQNPYSCRFCDKKCSMPSDLKVPIQTLTGEKPYECSCEKKFASACILTSHTKTHTGEEPFSCAVCDKKFAQSSELAVHFRTHKDENRYGCAHCDERFSRDTDLTIHMQVHMSKVLYSCSVCNLDFVYESDYEVHMVEHSGEKSYSCNICDKKFTTALYLQEHTRKHTVQKLLSCPHCDKTFTRSALLIKHMRKHPSDNSYPCKQCKKQFVSSFYLQAHVTKQHNKARVKKRRKAHDLQTANNPPPELFSELE